MIRNRRSASLIRCGSFGFLTPYAIDPFRFRLLFAIFRSTAFFIFTGIY